MITTATYFHPETCKTVKSLSKINFIGQSLPWFNQVRAAIRNQVDCMELEPEQRYFESFTFIHSADYVQTILDLSKDLKSQKPNWNAECSGFEYAIPGFEFGLGGLFGAIDLMKQGILDRAYCFSLPSHHAFPAKGHGYCILNSEAAAARYAQQQGFEKVLIVDWDIHHGDGTQTIFENDPSVYCISIHSAVDLYMLGIGSIELGTTTYAASVGHCNIPVLASYYDTNFYHNELKLDGEVYSGAQSIEVFNDKLHNLPWNPDIIIIFDGHDSHRDDCGKDITDWAYADFDKLTRLVTSLAIKHGCPILSMPGGGYNFKVSVEAAKVHFEALGE